MREYVKGTGVVIFDADPKSQVHIDGAQKMIGVGVQEGKLYPRTLEEILCLAEKGHLWLAHHTTGVIGCCALDVYNPRIAEVRSVFVMPSFRRAVIGSALVDAASAEAGRLGIAKVITITSEPEFFEVNGFRQVLDGQTPMMINNPQPTLSPEFFCHLQ